MSDTTETTPTTKRVRLNCSVNLVGIQQSQIIDVPIDTSDEDLQGMANEFLENILQPEAWYEDASDADDDEVEEW